MVVLQTLMYGMEMFWDRQINRGLRKILGVVRTTPVDAMLGEIGMKRVEWELEKKVARWGYRLARGKENGKLAEEVKEKMEEPGGVYEGGIIGRILRGLKENKLEGERWEVESERMEKIRWKDTDGRYMREK
ncbi:hypothetical protein C7212DRAFT_335967 [Tuber magnatum]|uniref:Uncharacterized protein n=1 Tax=Tuber magnatum TaxID=42249 RepID=A0A317SF08_9PEZI|nr:hypothetical protein C7212DRAFT_335967 [Tuber magnatum]